MACGTLGALLIGCLAIVLPPVAFWGELEINTLAAPTRPLPHLWPQARAIFLPLCYMLPHLWPQRALSFYCIFTFCLTSGCRGVLCLSLHFNHCVQSCREQEASL